MIELSRHIEILLLSNDCVIVPNLGGFMAHHIEAHYDEQENLFIPQLRTLGFNPMLKMNDSLLVQSYIEAYDLSYPEALRRIEDEVAELKQHLETEGSYELNDIGILSCNEDGNLLFDPCEAGILTPELYGLSSFEMKPLEMKPLEQSKAKPVVEKPVAIVQPEPEQQEETPTDETQEEEEKEHAIIIKMSWIRNAVATAAAVLAFVLMTTPVSNSESVNMSNLNVPVLTNMQPKDTDKLAIDVTKPEKPVETVKPDTITQQHTAQQNTTEQTAPADTRNYCIVLASYVSQKNAEYFVKKLHQNGYTSAEVFMRKDVRRVILGRYASESAAYNKLSTIRDQKDFEEAWVMKIQENS